MKINWNYVHVPLHDGMQVIGPSFAESFDVFLPSVLRYAKGSRPASDRAMAVGCLAEVFESIGP